MKNRKLILNIKKDMRLIEQFMVQDYTYEEDGEEYLNLEALDFVRKEFKKFMKYREEQFKEIGDTLSEKAIERFNNDTARYEVELDDVKTILKKYYK